MKYVLANWKANKTVQESVEWMKTFLTNDFSEIKDQFHIIIAPPFHVLSLVKELADQYVFLHVASQDISMFSSGAYTGEISSEMLYGLVDYALIGHSERRSLFHETNETVAQKTKQAKTFGIEAIVCVRGVEDTIPVHTKFILYEPVGAIGSGNNQPIAEVLEAKKRIDPANKYAFMYGGSVNESSINEYLSSQEIAGIIMGSASLDPTKFYSIIRGALS